MGDVNKTVDDTENDLKKVRVYARTMMVAILAHVMLDSN